MSRFTVVSTFSGCGGSSLGYKLAGGKVLLAVEWDKHAVETYRANFPRIDVYHGDIANLTVAEVLNRTKLKPGELDVFDGSPPCQGFSTAGKRVMDDPRNGLFREYVRLLRGLKPKVFVMENVSGMVKGKMRLIFVDILRELKASGYRVSCRLMNTKWFGVPQARQRVIFIGVRKDLKAEPSHPKAQLEPVTVREALAGVSVDEAEIALLLDAGKKYGAYNGWEKQKRGESLSKSRGTIAGFGSRKLDPDEPSPTIQKSDGQIGLYGTVHWAERRRPTRYEYARIGSFPDDFVWPGDDVAKRWKNAVSCIGNSVPPLFMKAIADHIAKEILHRGRR